MSKVKKSFFQTPPLAALSADKYCPLSDARPIRASPSPQYGLSGCTSLFLSSHKLAICTLCTTTVCEVLVIAGAEQSSPTFPISKSALLLLVLVFH